MSKYFDQLKSRIICIFDNLIWHYTNLVFRRLQLTALRIWIKFPRYLRDEKEKEKRRQEMRRKVASMLPDYDVGESKNSIDF